MKWGSYKCLKDKGCQNCEKKLIHLKKEISGITEKLLKENGTDITDLKHLTCAVATVIAVKIIKRGKTMKNTRKTLET